MNIKQGNVVFTAVTIFSLFDNCTVITEQNKGFERLSSFQEKPVKEEEEKQTDFSKSGLISVASLSSVVPERNDDTSIALFTKQ